MIGLKAENYLLTCRVESISSPSKSAPRIFQTSPEHPNARIIISPPYAAKAHTSSSGDIFDPQPPKPRKPSAAAASDDNISRRTSGRKRTATEKVYDFTSESESEDESYTTRRRLAKVQRINDTKESLNAHEPRRRKSSNKLLDSADTTPKKKDGNERSPKTSSNNKPNREKEARLDRKENEELYETLQKQVTIDLLKRR